MINNVPSIDCGRVITGSEICDNFNKYINDFNAEVTNFTDDKVKVHLGVSYDPNVKVGNFWIQKNDVNDNRKLFVCIEETTPKFKEIV